MKSTIDILNLIRTKNYNELENLTKEEANSFSFETNSLLHYVSQINLKMTKIILPKMYNINTKNILNDTALNYCKNEAIKNYCIKKGMKL